MGWVVHAWEIAAIHYKDSWVAEGVDEEMNEMSGEKAQEQACISGQEQVIEDQAQEYSPAEAVSIIGGDERNELKRKLSQKEIDKYEVDYKRSKRDGMRSLGVRSWGFANI